MKNKVICGDSLEVIKSIPDNSIDLILTDPPYGIGYDKIQDKMADSNRISNKGKWKKYNEVGDLIEEINY